MPRRNATLDAIALTIVEMLALIVLVILKLCRVISWSWWWVTFPLWLGPLIATALTVIALGSAVVIGIIKGTAKAISKRGNNNEI